MVSYNYRNFFIVLFLFTGSCAKTNLVGSYKYLKTNSFSKFTSNVILTEFTRSLILHKDSTFTYNEDDLSFDVGNESHQKRSLGKGKYQIRKNSLVLTFIPDILDVYNVEIDTLTAEDWYQIKFKIREEQISDLIQNNKNLIAFDINVNSAGFPVIVHVSHTLIGDRAYLNYGKSEFPLDLKFDFRDLPKGLRLNNKIITIEKPGNYKVKMDLFDNNLDANAEYIYGEKILPIHHHLIGDMVKVKDKK